VLTYNTVTNVWRAKDINGGAILRIRNNGVGRIGDVLYVTGGFDLVDGFGDQSGLSLQCCTDAYRASTNSPVFLRAAFPQPSADGVTGVISGRMYVLVATAQLSPTPCDANPCPLGTFRNLYRYDPVANSWVTRKSAPHYHRSGAGGVITGKFYVVGGFDSKGNATRNFDVYNPATDSWSTLALLPKPLIGLKASVLQNKLYVASTTAMYAYNPATNTWAQKAAPPVNSSGRAEGAAAVTVTLDGKQRMVVVGGKENSAGTPRTAVYTA
jgi:N-acetylneuraminic acid mutarotase